jgi:hypothetical protein
MFKQELMFPAAAAINFFSVTGLLILAGLLGKGSLAADIAVIQGAILAVFHGLSANARNLILASKSHQADEKSLFYFRLLVAFPAVVASYYLLSGATDVPDALFVGLVLRKCSEWLAELQLANREIRGDHRFAKQYIVLNSLGFLLPALTLMIPGWNEYFFTTIILWATIPAFLSSDHIRFVMRLKQFETNFLPLLPHIGSTTIIGVSTYVFRILIVILAGKSLAGQMFSAYALGGVISSLYIHAIGPTLVLRKSENERRLLRTAVFLCLITGTIAVGAAFSQISTPFEPIYLYGIGFSMIGGGIMIMAQRQRLFILQILHRDVFVPDALSNILLIGSIPFAYYIIGPHALPLLFLWSATLAFLFYIPLANRERAGQPNP